MISLGGSFGIEVNLDKPTYVTGILSPDYSDLWNLRSSSWIFLIKYFDEMDYPNHDVFDTSQLRAVIFGNIVRRQSDCKGWKIHNARATIILPSAYGNSQYRIRRFNFHREREEDVYIGKAGSCERICTRISPASRAAGRIGCSVDSSASSTKGGGGSG